MLKSLTLATVLSFTVSAWAECRLLEKSVSRGQITISERSPFTRDVIPSVNGGHACQIKFKARIGNVWHNAYGQANWNNGKTLPETCAVAATAAESELVERLGQQQVVQNRTMICDDDSKFGANQIMQVGAVADLSKFRPHPSYPKEFVHNGTLCRWFLDTVYNKDIVTMQGIICRLGDSKYVIVDKF